MTVSTEVTRVIVEGNGVTTTQSYSFPIPGSTSTDQTNAELWLTDTASVSTNLADNLWSITGVGTDVGGTFVYPLSGSPVGTGSFLTLNRIVPYLQPTELGSQGAYSPEVVMGALDNLAFQTEQLNTRASQAVRAPITDPALDDLPPVADRASGFLFFDDNGQPGIVNSTSGLPSSILVGTDSTTATLTAELLMTGSAVTSVVTVDGVTTATLTGGTTAPGGSSGQIQYDNAGAFGGFTMSGDLTVVPSTGVATLPTVNSNVGAFTNATVTVDGKGRVTAAASGSTGAGALVLLETHTASTSSSLDFTTFINSAYDVYVLIFNGLTVDTDAVDVNLLLGTGGGPSWSTSNYNWSVYNDPIESSNATISDVSGGLTTNAVRRQATSASSISIFPSVSSTAAYSLSGRIEFHNLRSASLYKSMMADLTAPLSSTPTVFWLRVGAWWKVATAVTGVRLIPSSGNLLAGTAWIYGYKNS